MTQCLHFLTRASLITALGLNLYGCGGVIGDEQTPGTETPVSPTASPTPTGTEPSSTPPVATPSASPAPLTPTGTPTGTPEPATPTPVNASPSPTDWAPENTPTPTPQTATPSPTMAPTPLPLFCGPGMVPVYSTPGSPLYCIDAYEVLVTGELGSRDQYSNGAVKPTATSASLENVIPSVLISYDQAVVICQNTPVLATDGETVLGYKHLATSQEWLDAADGLVGGGGSTYPYGNTYDSTLCATVDANGQQVYPELQPTGSFPNCHSGFGVYDQSGNAWEWANTGMVTDIEAWFVLASLNGLTVDADADDYLFGLKAKDATDNEIDMVGLQPISPSMSSDGHFYVTKSQIQVSQYEALKGYLRQHPSYSDPANNLPIQLIPQADGVTFYLLLLRAENERPVPDKRGGAYYVGNSYAYQSSASQRIHFHDFTGTIGFRCASEPYAF